MKNVIFGITILAVLTPINPAYANAKEATVNNTAQPVAGLIDHWAQFRAGIIARTSRYNKFNDIKTSQLAMLPQALVGNWSMVNRDDHSGYKIHAVLNLKKNHQFSYHYQVRAGSSRQHWSFSGHWGVKKQILVLLINKSTYPGEAPHDVLFWRLLQIGHTKLVYVRTGANRMQAMTRKGRAVLGS